MFRSKKRLYKKLCLQDDTKLKFQEAVYLSPESLRTGLGQCGVAGNCLPFLVDQDLVEIPARDPGDETQFLSHPLVEGMGILALDQ